MQNSEFYTNQQTSYGYSKGRMAGGRVPVPSQHRLITKNTNYNLPNMSCDEDCFRKDAERRTRMFRTRRCIETLGLNEDGTLDALCAELLGGLTHAQASK